MIYSFDTQMRSFPNSTAIAIIDKLFVIDRVQIIVKQVMDYSITKIGSEYFSDYGISDKKTGTWSDNIPIIDDIFSKLDKIGFVICFKL